MNKHIYIYIYATTTTANNHNNDNDNHNIYYNITTNSYLFALGGPGAEDAAGHVRAQGARAHAERPHPQ